VEKLIINFTRCPQLESIVDLSAGPADSIGHFEASSRRRDGNNDCRRL
jgi:hypothetical protein